MKKNKKFIFLCVVTALISSMLTGCLKSGTSETPGSDTTSPTEISKTKVNSDAKVIKISNGGGATLPAVIVQQKKFKQLIEEGTEGRYSVEVYHDGQLGDDTKSVEAVRAGTIEMTAPSTAPVVGLVKELAIFDLPFLFSSYEEADYVMDGELGKKLAEKVNEVDGLKLLAWWELGFRDLSTTKSQVTTPKELSGLKIRTMDNKYHLQAWKLMGASPVAISGSEIFTSLQQGVIDGQENPITNIFSQQIHTVSPYITQTEHIYSPIMLLISEKVWDTISAEDQKVFLSAGKESSIFERELQRSKEKECITEIKKNGGFVVALTDEQKKVFKDLAAPTWDTISNDVGKDWIELVKKEVAAYKSSKK